MEPPREHHYENGNNNNICGNKCDSDKSVHLYCLRSDYSSQWNCAQVVTGFDFPLFQHTLEANIT